MKMKIYVDSDLFISKFLKLNEILSCKLLRYQYDGGVLTRGYFSHKGLHAFYDYLIRMESERLEEINFNESPARNLIQLCSDFIEYKDLKEFQDKKGSQFISLDAIAELTDVIEIPDTKRFIVKNF